jgi:hypothetical protein
MCVYVWYVSEPNSNPFCPPPVGMYSIRLYSIMYVAYAPSPRRTTHHNHRLTPHPLHSLHSLHTLSTRCPFLLHTVYICISTHLNTPIHTYIHINTPIHTYTHTQIHIHIHTHTHTHTLSLSGRFKFSWNPFVLGEIVYYALCTICTMCTMLTLLSLSINPPPSITHYSVLYHSPPPTTLIGYYTIGYSLIGYSILSNRQRAVWARIVCATLLLPHLPRYVCICVYVCVYICMCIYVCVYMCMYVCV